MKATLLFVAGASPQIITETVWCLLPAHPVRTEICVLTTSTGRDAIRRQLLGRGGAWSRFTRQYPRARRFDLHEDNISVLCDARGEALADVRSGHDNATAADQIAAFVCERTRDSAPPVHASLAGGRKTMGYLLAAAMMLYGRREDRLSHVLVHPPALEGTDFFYPPARAAGTLSYRRADGASVKVPARRVRVELADLPFPRLRAVREMRAYRASKFSGLVSQLQEDLDTLAQPRVRLLPDGSSLLCSERRVRLSAVRFAIYELLAERRRTGCGQAECSGCPACYVPADEITGRFREQLEQRMRARGSFGVKVDKWGMNNFRSEVSKINGALQKALRSASTPYEIQRLGERNERLYGIALDPSAITIGTS